MSDFLSSSLWQGIGVIISFILAVISLIFTTDLRAKVFKSKNSLFDSKDMQPKELLDGQIVTLFGKVKEEVFAGPPNYESINDGDRPQFYWLLYVNEPIAIFGRCFESQKLSEYGNTCCFQLALKEDFYDNRNDILDKFVKVDGQVFLGHTGCHKTKALIDVAKIEVVT
ncbi:hypothetical protein PRUB_b0309 [Pseudoalteromonas rubra]|uniref:DUF4431 domain-containing protein n=1 Tax=Pseudoalteromonas rubra TaxID=43658 RepID=A0A8T0BZ74_9GAMM|nr:DUF4431 domain-containing protein [Pseudoalteromonas rubra]KAF7781170.1 hypothetical protein PRUB_b0309 [Pseudoalteromonas rubra]